MIHSEAKRWAPQRGTPSIRRWSIEAMVGGYERLIVSMYAKKAGLSDCQPSVVRGPLSVAGQ